MNEGVNEGVRDGRMNIGFSISSFGEPLFKRELYQLVQDPSGNNKACQHI
jgi:hypothetical protein